MLDIFLYPFMQRAFVAGGITALLLGLLGTYVVSRRMSFLGDGIAHASLAGVALALLLGWAPIPVAIVFAVVLAFVLYALEEKIKLASDMALGIIFTTGMALGVILLHFYPGYQPELLSYLFGNILAITSTDVMVIAVLGVVVVSVIFLLAKRFAFVTFDQEGAHLAGLRTHAYVLLLYVFTAVAIVLSVRVVGMILVSALLILPSALSRLHTHSFRAFQVGAGIWSLVLVFLGLAVSYVYDLPSGATIIVCGSGLLILVACIKYLVQKIR